MTLGGIGLEAFQDGFFDAKGDPWVDFAWGNEIDVAIELFFEDFSGIRSGKGFLSGENLVDGDAIGEDVGSMVNGLALELFWGHVGRGTRVLGQFLGLIRSF